MRIILRDYSPGMSSKRVALADTLSAKLIDDRAIRIEIYDEISGETMEVVVKEKELYRAIYALGV